MSDIVSIGKRGWCEAAIAKNYDSAIITYSEGIRKFPSSVEMYNNRCYCYIQLYRYKEALEDADEMVSKFPKDYRGYFRRGEALSSLGRFKEADTAFGICLSIKPDHDPAYREKVENIIKRLCKGGKYTRSQVVTAIQRSDSCEEAENLLHDGFVADTFKHQLYHSDDEDETPCWRREINSVKALEDPKNPVRSHSIHVSHMRKEVSWAVLYSVFSRYGTVQDIQSHFDFGEVYVKYTDPSAAGRAMAGLQGKTIGSNKNILVRYPSKYLKKGK